MDYYELIEEVKSNPNQYEKDIATAYCYFRLGLEDQARDIVKHYLGMPEALLLLGHIELMNGNLEEAYPLLESRYKTWGASMYGHRPQSKPVWDGYETNEKVLLWAAEGFGDTIQMLRFIPYVKTVCPNLILEVQADLLTLCQFSFPDVKIYPYIENHAPEHDKQLCLLSLPYVTQTRLEIIPNGVPYLHAGLATYHNQPVGLCWKTDSKNNELDRSITDEQINYLGERHDFFSLQKGTLKNFNETAALINQSELVITIDSAIAHLTGALGKDVWLLLSKPADSRWMKLDYSPWYPTMRIFRQKTPGDWQSVLEEVDVELTKWEERNKKPIETLWSESNTGFGPASPSFSFFATDSYQGKCLLTYSDYSPGETRLFEYYVKEGDYVVEAGACFGWHTRTFSRLVGDTGKVFAFEPQKHVFDLLVKNIPNKNTTFYQYGLGETQHQAWMPEPDYTHIANFGSLKVMEEELPGAVQVIITTIDDMKLEKLDFIKLDIEGMELEALKGGEETINKFKPIIYCEWNYTDIIPWLEEHGYEITRHNPPLVEPKEGERNIFPQIVSQNILAINKNKQ